VRFALDLLLDPSATLEALVTTRLDHLRRPDDWHLHLRDGAGAARRAAHTAAQFARAIVMPNLKPPVTTVARRAPTASASSPRCPRAPFEPLMTLYLTDRTPAERSSRRRRSGFVHGFKLYPAGATTNSDSGVTDDRNASIPCSRDGELRPAAAGARRGDHADVDVFDRERVFIDAVLAPLGASRGCASCSSTSPPAAVEFVRAAGPNVAATITPQHLLLNRNAMFQGGIRPHLLPAGAEARTRPPGAARGRDQRRPALLPRHRQRAARAPHQGNACGCAGIYSRTPRSSSTPRRSSRRARLDRLEAFASRAAPTSTACRATPARSRCGATLDSPGRVPLRRCRARPRCAPAKTSRGARTPGQGA
jgi:dihydroorotase